MLNTSLNYDVYYEHEHAEHVIEHAENNVTRT